MFTGGVAALSPTGASAVPEAPVRGGGRKGPPQGAAGGPGAAAFSRECRKQQEPAGSLRANR
eukprot:13860509-Alexandrium_andersonii.AAC.1